MSHLIARLSPLSDSEFSQKEVSPFSIERRVEGLKREFAGDLRNFTKDPSEYIVSAGEKIQKFILDIQTRSPSLNVGPTQEKLTRYVEKKARNSLDRRIFKIEQIVKEKEKALFNEVTLFLSIPDYQPENVDAKGSLALAKTIIRVGGEDFVQDILKDQYLTPLVSEQVHSMLPNLIQEAEKLALILQATRISILLKKFLEVHKKSLEKLTEKTKETRQFWTEQATSLERPILIVDFLKRQTPPNLPTLFERAQLRGARTALDKEFKLLHELKNSSYQKDSFSIPEEVLDRLSIQTNEFLSLLETATQSRSSLYQLKYAQTAAIKYEETKQALEEKLDGFNQKISTLFDKILAYKERNNFSKTLQKLERELENFEREALTPFNQIPEDLKKLFPNIDFSLLKFSVNRQFSITQEKLEKCKALLQQFKDLKDGFSEGHFELLSAQHFSITTLQGVTSNLPEAFYNQLERAIQLELADLSNANPNILSAARLYRDNLREFLLTQREEIQQKLGSPNLDKSITERFLSWLEDILKFLKTLFTCCSSSNTDPETLFSPASTDRSGGSSSSDDESLSE